jgi:hypothetical protein
LQQNTDKKDEPKQEAGVFPDNDYAKDD